MFIGGQYSKLQQVVNQISGFKTYSRTDSMFKNIMANEFVAPLSKNVVKNFPIPKEVEVMQSTFKEIYENVKNLNSSGKQIYDDENVEVTSYNGYYEQLNLSSNKLATNQVNQSDYLTNYSAFNWNDEDYLTVKNEDGKIFSYSFTEEEFSLNTDDKITLLAEKISEDENGLEAKVEENEEGNIALSISSELGKSNSFELFGSISEDLGFKMIQKAQNSEIEVNGIKFESEKNDFSLFNDSLNIKLKSASNEKTSLFLKEEKSEKNLKEFVDNVNKLKEIARSSDNEGIQKLEASIDRIIKNKIDNLGIMYNDDNFLELNDNSSNTSFDFSSSDVYKLEDIFRKGIVEERTNEIIENNSYYVRDNMILTEYENRGLFFDVKI